MSAIDIFRRPMSWYRSLSVDLPGVLERTSERGDWAAKAVLILAPLWLTPQRYGSLSRMRHPMRVLGSLWMAASLWTLASRLSFPEIFVTLAPRVDEIGRAMGYWDPAWAGTAAAILFGVVTFGLFGAAGVSNYALAYAARRISEALGFHQGQSPPLGYHVLTAAGHLASLSFIMLLIYAVFSVNAGLVVWLSRPEPLQTVLVLGGGGVGLATGVASRSIYMIRAAQIYGSVRRALLCQVLAPAVLLVFALILLRI